MIWRYISGNMRPGDWKQFAWAFSFGAGIIIFGLLVRH